MRICTIKTTEQAGFAILIKHQPLQNTINLLIYILLEQNCQEENQGPLNCSIYSGRFMDKLDRRILKALQDEFPLSAGPYDILAKKLHITCDQLWNRIQKMIKDGLIRRIGVSLDSKRIGFSSTLAAVSISEGMVEQAAEIIGSFSEVTHSYLRNDEFNIWFTIIAPDDKRIDYVLERIRSHLSLKDSQVLNLPAKRLFKLDARFNIAP